MKMCMLAYREYFKNTEKTATLYVTNLFGDVVDNHGMLFMPAEELIFGNALFISLKCYQRNSFKSGQTVRNAKF